jgi:cell wall-associated NlpC family hydrolase
MPHATLRARLGVIAATTTLTIVGVFAATATASTADTSAVPTAAPAMSLAAPKPAAHTSHKAHRTARQIRAAKVRRVLREARRQKGKPYVYGGAGPHSFDCSGLVRYVFMHSVGRVLPHNAAAQYHSVRHIKRRHLLPGDLIFTDNGYISHVGIFAGHHHSWVAPHTGTHVQLQRIYHAHFLYGRVLVVHKHLHHVRHHRHHARHHRH